MILRFDSKFARIYDVIMGSIFVGNSLCLCVAPLCICKCEYYLPYIMSNPILSLVVTNYCSLSFPAEEAMAASGAAGDAQTPDELVGLTPEQADQLRAEWSRELARVEDEIATLRTVLQSKVTVDDEHLTF